MRWVAGPAPPTTVQIMAVTETGHLAAREVDDLYRRHGAEVYRYAFAVLGNHADAEDVTQTTFLNAYRSLEQGVRPRKPANWLLTIASNAIKQRFRQEQSRPRHVELDDHIAGQEADDDGPSVGELLTALSKIPPQQRQAIVLREFEGRSYNEIAEILGVTTSALETLLFRARRSLAEELPHQLTCTEAQLAVSRVGRRPARTQGAQARARPPRRVPGLRAVRAPPAAAPERAARAPARPDPALARPVQGSRRARTGVRRDLAGRRRSAAGRRRRRTGAAPRRRRAAALAGGVGLKVAAVVAAASVAGGIAVAGAPSSKSSPRRPARLRASPVSASARRSRGVTVPGNGVARGKATAPGQTKEGNA